MPVDLPTTGEVSHLCHTKSSWAQDWTERALLQCLQITDALAPSHSSATFSHVYGTGMMPAIGSRPADHVPTVLTKPNLLGHYVRVTLSNGIRWWGILVEQDDQQLGTLNGTASGRISYTAYALTFLLERGAPLRQTKVKTGTAATSLINIGIPFNGGSDGRKERTRVSGANFDTTLKCFTDRTMTTAPELWTARRAMEYLIAEFPLKNSSDTEQIPLHMSIESKRCLEYDLPEIRYHGMNRWELLSQLVDRRRGLVMYTKITAAGQLEIVVDSSGKEQTTLPGGAIVPRNRNQRTYDFDDAVNVSGCSVSTSAVQFYDQVEVIGEPLGVVFSVSPATTNGQLEPDWGTTEETEYNTAASADTGYSALSTADKKAANADARARDKFAPVYSWWRLKSDWDGKGRSESTGEPNNPAVIKLKDDGELEYDEVAKYWVDGLRFADFVPMRPNVDYTEDVDPDIDSRDDDQQKDYLAPIVWVKPGRVNEQSGSLDKGWVHAERLNAAIDADSTKRPHEWSMQIKERKDAPGLILEVVGKPQHFAAIGAFTGTGNSTHDPVPSSGAINLRDWIATVYMPLQQHVRCVHPKPVDVTSGDVKRVLSIPLARCHCDYLVSGTVVKVEKGDIKTTTGGLLRDDRDRARDLAKLAYQWYGTPRQTLNLNFRGIPTGFAVGQLITAVNQDGTSQQINTVISSITLDLQGYSTSVRTNFAELDFLGLMV